MTIGPDDVGTGSTTMQERFSGQPPERFAGQAGGYRPTRRDGAGPMDRPQEPDLAPRNGSGPGLDPVGPADRPPTLPSLDLGGLSEPVFPPAAWLDAQGGTLAEHPLLRGLLLELPPKGTVPPPGWLDRWFEAARSILELLYIQDAGRPR